MTYATTIKTWNFNGATYEIRVTATSIYWGIFKNGQKVTDFMNCAGSSAPQLIAAYIKRKGLAA